MKVHVRKIAMGLLLLAALGNTGCIDSLMQNIWTGFGLSIGGFPASYLLDTFLGGTADTEDNDNANDNNG